MWRCVGNDGGEIARHHVVIVTGEEITQRHVMIAPREEIGQHCATIATGEEIARRRDGHNGWGATAKEVLVSWEPH